MAAHLRSIAVAVSNVIGDCFVDEATNEVHFLRGRTTGNASVLYGVVVEPLLIDIHVTEGKGVSVIDL